MFAALVSFPLTSVWSLSVSFWTKNMALIKSQTLTWGHVPVLPPPRSPLMWLSLKPGSVFSLRFVFFCQNEAIAVPLLQAECRHKCRSYLRHVMFDMCDKISDLVTKCINEDCKVSPCIALKQRRGTGIVLYIVLCEVLYRWGDQFHLHVCTVNMKLKPVSLS